jgi:RNA polymerase sigma-70 factor (ECF subfamily)
MTPLQASAFNRLVNKHSEAWIRYIMHRGIKRHDAEDQLHDVLVELMSKGEFNPCVAEAEALSFVYQLITWRLPASLRSRRKEQALGGEVNHLANLHAQNEVPPWVSMTLAEERQQICEEVNRLPPRQREAIYLRYWHGFSTEHIAKMLATSPRGVYMLISHAKTRLRTRLGRDPFFAIDD